MRRDNLQQLLFPSKTETALLPQTALLPPSHFFTAPQIAKNIGITFEKNIGRSNEILGWEGIGNRILFCFFKV
jgi:hypothetical protein